MELILFIYVLVAIVVTGHVLLVREKDVDGAVPAVTAVTAVPAVTAVDLLPGEEEDHWELLAEDWEFPEIGKKQSPVMMTGDCRYNRALRGCGRRGKGKQKGGKHINKKRLRRADTMAHLSILEELI